MGLLIRDSRQQTPVHLLGVLFKQRTQVGQDAVDGAQEGAGINIVEPFAVAEVLLLKARQSAVLVNHVEEVQHGGGEGVIAIFLAKPRYRLLVGNIQRHRQLGMHALEQANSYGVGNGIGQLPLSNLQQQIVSA